MKCGDLSSSAVPPHQPPGHSNYLLWSFGNMVSSSTFHLPVSSSISYVKEGKLLKHCIGTAWCYNFNFYHCFKFLQQVSVDTNNMKIVECVSTQYEMDFLLWDSYIKNNFWSVLLVQSTGYCASKLCPILLLIHVISNQFVCANYLLHKDPLSIIVVY